MSANRKIADDMADQVVTVADGFLRPRPAIRTHTFASVFEMSSPAQRACTTSMTASSTPRKSDGGLGRESGNS